jgi:hypothetical protein
MLERGFSDVGGQSRFAGAPFFIKRMKRNNASYVLAMGRRQCTRHYKVDVIKQALRRLLGYGKGKRIPAGSVEVWIGISLDEVIRKRPARDKWQVNRHPLLELRMTREQCLSWLKRNGYPIPGKSACTFCPFQSNAQWRAMKANDPTSFDQACRIDETVREASNDKSKGELFVHRSLLPLREVDFSDPNQDQQDLFGNECEGMCGV